MSSPIDPEYIPIENTGTKINVSTYSEAGPLKESATPL